MKRAMSLRSIRHHLSMLPRCSRRTPTFTGKSEHRSKGLTLRPTGLGSAADKDRRDYTVFSGEFAVGRIYEERAAPADLQWFWAITGIFGTPADMRMDGHAPTLESAEIELGETWRTWLTWARLTEIGGVKRDDFCMDRGVSLVISRNALDPSILLEAARKIAS